MDGFNWLGWKQPQTQQVLAADTGVRPAKIGMLRDAKHLEDWRTWLWVTKRLYDYCMIWELGMWVSPGFLATALWPLWLVRRSAWGWCYLQQPSTISHSEPQSLLVFMIWFWPTISSCQRSEQLTPGTLVASHPASSWIKMVLPPSWDHHFKMWSVARMFTWRHPLQALFVPKISQLHPVATALFEIRGTSGITLLDGPVRRTKPCQGCWPWRYFLDRPSHICSGHGGIIDIPLNINICICTVFEVTVAMSWLGCIFQRSTLWVCDVSGVQ